MNNQYPTVDQVDVTNIYGVNETSKGERTFRINLPFPASTIVDMERNPGDEVGNHFHPNVPEKNPEYLYLTAGSCRFWFTDTSFGEREEYLEATPRKRILVKIPPYILHGMEVLKTVRYFEPAINGHEPEHTQSAEEFWALVTSLLKSS